MDQADETIGDLQRLIVNAVNIVFSGLSAGEAWLRAQLAHLGIGPHLQSAALVIVVLALLVPAMQLIGGIIRLVVVLLIVLLAAHLIAPMLHA